SCRTLHSYLALAVAPPSLLPSPLLSYILTRPPPRSTSFPYTTLFRSDEAVLSGGGTGGENEIRSCPLRDGTCTDALNCRSHVERDRKSTRLNSSHLGISYAVFCLKKKKK